MSMNLVSDTTLFRVVREDCGAEMKLGRDCRGENINIC